MKRYVIYRRVSTKRQGDSGLGLEAQDRDIQLFLDQYSEEPYEILGTFTDVQSGSDNNRPELERALDMVRNSRGSELLVAKLDRLSRRVSYIATLMDDPKVSLRVAAMPHADKFQLHIFAALSEQEREFISLRTKQALAAAKARGRKLGGDRGSLRETNLARKRAAKNDAAKAWPLIEPMRREGRSLRSIASALNDSGYKTARGNKWSAETVRSVIKRFEAEDVHS